MSDEGRKGCKRNVYSTGCEPSTGAFAMQEVLLFALLVFVKNRIPARRDCS